MLWLPGYVPCHAETRPPLRSTVVLQVLVDALAGLEDAVERIAGAGNLKTDRVRAKRLSGDRVDSHTRAVDISGLVEARSLGRIPGARGRM